MKSVRWVTAALKKKTRLEALLPGFIREVLPSEKASTLVMWSTMGHHEREVVKNVGKPSLQTPSSERTGTTLGLPGPALPTVTELARGPGEGGIQGCPDDCSQ